MEELDFALLGVFFLSFWGASDERKFLPLAAASLCLFLGQEAIYDFEEYLAPLLISAVAGLIVSRVYEQFKHRSVLGSFDRILFFPFRIPRLIYKGLQAIVRVLLLPIEKLKGRRELKRQAANQRLREAGEVREKEVEWEREQERRAWEKEREEVRQEELKQVMNKIDDF